MADTRSPDEWSRLSSLVDALLEAPAEQRAALIAELSGNDATRQAELQRLVSDLSLETPLSVRPAAERFAALLDGEMDRFPQAFAEKYQLTRIVARGGMATVYLARDLKHARDVAVKVVHPFIAASLGSERFLREIEIVARLRHPHIVPLFDSGDASGTLYYVMPFETGQSLRERLARSGALPIDDVVTVLRDICDALAYAHAHGIVHRDIKPDNVMMSGRHAMVTDFGVAKALSSNDAVPLRQSFEYAVRSSAAATAGSAFGTPAYMSPEQILGDPVDHRADIYSVGVLAYELIAGRPPFGSARGEDVLTAHISRPAPSLASVGPEVPEALAQLVAKCLAKRPEDRWQSADEIIEGLERIASSHGHSRPTGARRTRLMLAALGLATIAAVAYLARRRDSAVDNEWEARWRTARVERLTDFPGSEVDAAISADGRYAAFLADQDSVFDAFTTVIGSGQFTNLTRGAYPQLLNEDVRNIGFSADGRSVSLRLAQLSAPASVWLTPTTGGALRPFLETAVMAAWSPDSSRVAYHETTPGDPIYVADASGANARKLFTAAPGVHNHHVSWSPDGRYLVFSHGLPPNDMDIWRIPAVGGAPEQLTNHASRVAYPVMIDDQTLIYTATADDGTGPWLYSVDLRSRQPTRVINAVEHYISIAAAAEVPGAPRRLVATVSNPAVGLWSVPVTDGAAASEDSARRIVVPTARSAAPRFGADGSLVYLASRGGADAIWRLSGGVATQVWRAAEGEIAAAPAVSPDGSEICFPVRVRQRSTLSCITRDGARQRSLADSLDIRGPASWSPDGRWLAVAAKDGQRVRVYKVPTDGGPPMRLVDSVSSSPVWSPDGEFIVYSGTPQARSVPVNAVTPDGRPYAMPPVLVDRVGDSYRFVPGTNRLIVKLGGFRRQDFWLLDVATGDRRRLTTLRPGESLHRFDVSPDGRRILFERVRENSDIALITLPPR